jgi:hypothetical protein
MFQWAQKTYIFELQEAQIAQIEHGLMGGLNGDDELDQVHLL